MTRDHKVRRGKGRPSSKNGSIYYTKTRALERAFKNEFPDKYHKVVDRLLTASDNLVLKAYESLPDTKAAAKVFVSKIGGHSLRTNK